mgnify:CR=1 FL=1
MGRATPQKRYGRSASGTELERYRAKDLRELVERVARIENVEDWLVRRTMERIEIGAEGIRVRWLVGKEIWSVVMRCFYPPIA